MDDNWLSVRATVTEALQDVLNEALRDPTSGRRAQAVRLFAATIDPEDGYVRSDLLRQMIAAEAEGWVRWLLEIGLTATVGRRLMELKQRAPLLEP
jgi:hypothetical protein